MKLVWDIETDGIDATTIWCLCAHDVDTGIEYKFSDYDDDLLGSSEALALLGKADVHIGHNLIGYDLVQVSKIWGFELQPHQKVYDTWVMSQTLRFKRNHRHGLAGWGEHLGNSKISFDDWDKYSKEMLRYCMQDVRVNRDVYNELMKEFQQLYRINPMIREGLKIEHDAAHFNAFVRERGWKFDMKKAKASLKSMKQRMAEIEKIIEPQLGEYTVYIDKEPRSPKFKKNGNFNMHTVRQLSEYFGREVKEDEVDLMPPGSTFQRTKQEQIKLVQMDLVKEWLRTIGWKPDEYTRKKIDGRWVNQSPKLTETSLAKLGETGVMIGEYNTLRNRTGVIIGWIDQVKDGRLHGNMWTIGTPTFRVRHEVIVNLPGVHTAYGKELRELLIADEGYVVVGADSAGNQLRGLCHFVGNDGFTHEVIHGDQHSRNAEILGCTRPLAKNYLYAYLFGAGDAKLGSVLTGKPDTNVGKQSRDKFAKGIKGLAELREKISISWKNTTYRQGIGWFHALDGRPVFAESEHQCLNYLLQATEGITCKAALSYAWDKIKAEGLDAEPRLFYHDELAFVASEKDADRVGEILQESFREAPKKFGVQIMDGGDYVKGQSYADVH